MHHQKVPACKCGTPWLSFLHLPRLQSPHGCNFTANITLKLLQADGIGMQHLSGNTLYQYTDTAGKSCLVPYEACAKNVLTLNRSSWYRGWMLCIPGQLKAGAWKSVRSHDMLYLVCVLACC